MGVKSFYKNREIPQEVNTEQAWAALEAADKLINISEEMKELRRKLFYYIRKNQNRIRRPDFFKIERLKKLNSHGIRAFVNHIVFSEIKTKGD